MQQFFKGVEVYQEEGEGDGVGRRGDEGGGMEISIDSGMTFVYLFFITLMHSLINLHKWTYILV